MNRFTLDSFKNQKGGTKRWLNWLTFCAVFLIGTESFSQTTEVVSLGTYTGAGSTNVLLSTSTTANKYSRTISLYTSFEILMAGGMPGSITSLAWDKSGVGEYTFGDAYIKIYLKHVTQEQWTYIPEWDTEIIGATEVFTSSTYSIPTGTGWKEVSFTTPFEWNGIDNVAVLVEWYRPSTPTGDISWGRSTNTLANASRVGSTSLEALEFLINDNRPLVQFTIQSSETITCPIPTELSINNVTDTSVELSWTSDGTLFEIEYGPIGFTPGTGTLITGITGSPYTFTNLEAQTTYQYYIRRDCGEDDGYSFLIGASFTTACGALTSAFFEGFEGIPTGSSTNPTLPNCWSLIDTGAGYGYTNATTPQEGIRNFYMYNGTSTDTGTYILVSPLTDNLGNGTMRVKFWARTTATAAPATTIDFGTLSNPTDENTFTVVQSIPLTNVYTEYVVELPVTTDDYFGFRHDLVTKARYIYIDSISYEEIPACADIPLITLNASNLTDNSANLSWQGVDSLFDIEWGLSGFVQGTGTIVTEVDNPYSLTGLEANTSYDFYVRQNCGDDVSPWTGPFNFTTACGVTTAGFFEGFESTATGSTTNPTLPDCWSLIDTGGGYGYTSATTPQEGVRNFYMYNGPSTDTGHYILVSPETDNLGNGTMRVRFWARTTASTAPATTIDFGTLSDPSDETTFTVIESIPLTTTYTEYVVILPETTDDYFGIRHDLVTKARYIYIDSISYEELPSCLEPSDLSVTALSLTSAEFSWESDGAMFDIEWGEQGFSLGSGTLETGISSTSYEFTDLTLGTTYEFYVRQDCGDGDTSVWIGPISHYAGYCIPIFSTGCTSGDGINSFTIEGSGINHLDSGCSPAAYGDFTMDVDLQGSLQQGETYEFTVTHTYLTNQWLKLWIDFNGNGSFEDEELLFASSSGSAGGITTGSFTIPFTAPLTEGTVLRAIVKYASVPDNACVPGGTFGETHDYMVAILPPPACPTPSGLIAENITSTTADLSWVVADTDNTFELEWGESGFTPGSGTLVTGLTTTTYSLSDLNPMTAYEFYVRQDCGDDGYSIMAGPFTFTTACGVVNAGFFEGFEDVATGSSTNPTLPDCWSLIDTGAGYGYTSATTPQEGIRNFYMYNGASTDTGTYILVSPLTDNLGNGTMRVKFWARTTATAAPATTIDFGTLSDPTDETTFTSLQTFALTTDYTEYIVLLPETTDDYFGFRHDLVTKARYIYIDSITYEEIPACPEPLGLEATNITTTSADISWVSDGTLFDVEWGVSGFVQGEGTTIFGITTTTSTLSDLSPNTSYDFYVRQDCGDEESPWTGPFTFNTSCGVSTSGFYEGFETTATGSSTNPTLPDCWSFIDTGAGYGYVNATTPQEGIRNFYMYNGAASDAGTYILVSPQTENLGNGTMRVKFWARTTSTVTTPAVIIDFGTLSDPTDETTFTAIASISLTTIYTEYKVIIPETTDDYFGIRHDLITKARGVYIDSITYEEIPSCLEPWDLDVTNITTASAELFWEIDNGAVFDIEWGIDGFTPGTGTMVMGVGNPYILSDLSPATTYQYYVRQDCGNDDESIWVGPVSFTTLCIPVSTLDENFDGITAGTGVLPACWSKIGTGSAYVSTTNPYSVPNNLYMYKSSNAAEEVDNYLVSPYLDNLSDNTHWLRFKARTTSTSTTTLTVGYLTDATDPDTFVEIETITFVGTAYPTEDFIIFPWNLPIEAKHLAFRNDINLRTIYLDDIRWEAAPDCMYPMNLNAANISVTSTSLSWVGTGSLYDIEYGLSGFSQGTGTVVAGVGNPYVLSDLTTGVEYDYYVRQDCGDDGYSVWSGPYTFTPGAYSGNIPTMLNANPQVDDDACAMIPFSIDVPEGYYLSALNVQYVMNSWNTAFQSHQRSVLYSPTLNMGEPEVVAGETDFPGLQPYNRDVDFANGATGTIEFVLKAWRTENGSGCSADHVYVVDGSWILSPEFTLIPTCPEPTDLSYANPTLDSVDLMWTGEDGAMYDIQWGLPGFAPEDIEGTLITDLSSTSYTLSGLDSSIVYEFYVRRNCSSDDGSDYSAWIGPVKFNSGHCIPSSQYNHYISTFLTTNGEANISYYSTSINGSGYGDNTAMVVSDLAGESFNFSLNYVGGGSGLRIWVDWNSDYIFDSSEEVFYLANASGNKTGVINIPTDVLPGDYVMRVRVEFGASASPQACGHIEYGEALDFTLHVATVCEEVATPMGETTQTLTEGQTLADLVVGGANLTWYSDASLTEEIPATTEAVDGTTYYVTQTIDGCESEALAIYVEVTLSTDRFDEASFRAYPNPVRDILNISYSKDISEVAVINMLGQVVISEQVSTTDAKVDMSGLPTGNYLVKVTVDGTVKTIKVMKQ